MITPTYNAVTNEDGSINYIASNYNEAVKAGEEASKNPSFVPGPEFLADLENVLKVQYRGLRQFEYPPILDFIDAYYWERKGDSSKMDAYISKIDEIKAKYPKPE